MFFQNLSISALKILAIATAIPAFFALILPNSNEDSYEKF